MKYRISTPWWMRVENWFRRYVFRMNTVRAVIVEEPGVPSKFAPKFEKKP